MKLFGRGQHEAAPSDPYKLARWSYREYTRVVDPEEQAALDRCELVIAELKRRNGTRG